LRFDVHRIGLRGGSIDPSDGRFVRFAGKSLLRYARVISASINAQRGQGEEWMRLKLRVGSYIFQKREAGEEKKMGEERERGNLREAFVERVSDAADCDADNR